MEPVSLNDGLDRRETIAFGLTAAEVAVAVLALLSAYATLRSPLPGAAGWALATLLIAAGAALAWGRLWGRPLLEWAVLLSAFAARNRGELATRVRRWTRGHVAARAPAAARAVVVPLRPHVAAVPAAEGRAPTTVSRGEASGHVVGFMSLRGGTGRTTLAVEMAAVLAVRARSVATRAGRPGVALVDLCTRSPAAGLRLGIPLIGEPGPVLHETGLRFVGPPEGAAPPPVEAMLAAGRADGERIVVADLDGDLGPRCRAALERCDQVIVVLTPTAGGVLDAYRTTAALRRLGLRDRLAYAVNRCRGTVDLAEPIADLGGSIVAEVPEDPAFVDAENRHRLAGLDGPAHVTAAIALLAVAVERDAARRMPVASGSGRAG